MGSAGKTGLKVCGMRERKEAKVKKEEWEKSKKERKGVREKKSWGESAGKIIHIHFKVRSSYKLPSRGVETGKGGGGERVMKEVEMVVMGLVKVRLVNW